MYQAGDVLMMLPKNDYAMVSEFITLVGFQPVTLVKISIDKAQLG